ncbi:MAG: GH92 family glycosyl hydrolase [Saprospiraceae bacterium]|nr:GH92 family glycosyl hydrolase [Saprospiraceae bacterium]MCB9318448.1 glycoside hydrolase family 92 protein [Lewinellaceae bacterium]
MRTQLFSGLLLMMVSALTAQPSGLADLINPLMGTDSRFDMSHGNTYPSISLPWGMNSWTPMTNKMGDGWTYQYSAQKIRGIKQTHQPSPWINDYAAFSLMAVTGKLKFQEEERASWFSHKAEVVHPYHYSVYLADYDVTMEMAPTERASHFQFTFPMADSAFILLDAFNGGSMVRIIPEERKIIGYCRNNHGGVPENFHNYFVAVFDHDFEITDTWSDEWQLVKNSRLAEGDHVGAIIGFSTKRGDQVHVKVASSFISPEQAERNLKQEIGNDTFIETKEKAQGVWEKELGRIQVTDDHPELVETFYSCLYRMMLFPREFFEIGDRGEVLHYSPYNGTVQPGYLYTDNGFWDTFRAVFPFFNLMYPSLTTRIMKGLVNTYKESGWLPEWASPGHRDCMVGSNSASLIADAYLKGNIPDEKDADILLDAMLKNGNIPDGRPVSSVGRAGVEYYNELGYVPYDVGIPENAARTLEYAYDDFALAQMAAKMGKKDIADRFYRQAQNYKNLFDPTHNLMRGKNEDGQFQTPFNPLKWGDAFTEGNSLHYTWSVFQDIQGLINLMGGDQPFVSMLDTVFAMAPNFDDSYYGFTIHEIREMQVMDMGNYAHGNQPIQHMIYLYDYAREPWKTQYWARQVMRKLYSPTPDGYCGDEDNGQTSAWYVFSALGFYPVTPASDQYVIGSPLFDQITLKLENGKTMTIVATQDEATDYYIQSLQLNGKPIDRTFLTYPEIMQGGTLHFKMADQPDKRWATGKDSVPFSMTKN